MKTIDDLSFSVPREIETYTSHSAEIAIMIINYIHSIEGMTKKKFAELVGKSPNDITRWLSGGHNFTLLTLSLIEARTGMSIIKSLTTGQIEKYLKGNLFKLDENLLFKEICLLKAEVDRLQKELKPQKELISAMEKMFLHLQNDPFLNYQTNVIQSSHVFLLDESLRNVNLKENDKCKVRGTDYGLNLKLICH